MSLKLIAVRIPESMHSYLKIKSAKDKVSLQDLVTQAIGTYQAEDDAYQAELSQFAADALKSLPHLTNNKEVSSGV